MYTNFLITYSEKKLNRFKEDAIDYSHRDLSKYNSGNYVVLGMRRTGKTEYLKYRYKNSKLEINQVLFITFDAPEIFSKFSTKNGFEIFSNSLREILDSKQIKLVLIDEIQLLNDWSILLKHFIDEYPEIEFVATGSDSFALKRSSEYGVDRFKIIYSGIMTFAEIVKMYPGTSLVEYMDDYSFPKGLEFQQENRLDVVLDKQLKLSKIESRNIYGVLLAIYQNPGWKTNNHKVGSIINEFGYLTTKLDTVQIENILSFLEDSSIIYRLLDSRDSLKLKKSNRYTIYPLDWSMYRWFNDELNYEKLPNKVGDVKTSILPSKGFVFENMIISNVYTKLRTDAKKKLLLNAIDQPDWDFEISGTRFEIKSFDVLKSSLETKVNIINKSRETMSKIIHFGNSGFLGEGDMVEVISAEEFLLNMEKFINKIS